ncbi:NAD(P)-binding protein [Annulohypoxylon nitens]|nr:NAD(P)-binding protein [Annulohypoxylon nitens]
MGNVFSQFYFIPAPTLTEKNCPNQRGRVFIVTGGYTGIGYELCKILYAHNANVWVAGRSVSKAQGAISRIKEAVPSTEGRLEFLQLDLSDLSTIKPAVESFISQEQRLDVLVNNAGVMYPPAGSKDAQGHDLQVGTNCLGPYLLYQLLSPLLIKTAASSPTASVRVVWAASIALHVALPHPEGIVIDKDGRPTDQGVDGNYSQTKAGNVFMAREFAKATPQTGVVHAAFNPGNLQTELQRHWTGFSHWVTETFLVRPPIHGAYTELWAALTPELTPEKSGAYVYPWGRFGTLPAPVEKAMKTKPEGGSGVAFKFLEWCGKQTSAFA